MEKIYTAKAVATGGRNGHVATDDKVIDLELRMPGSPDKGAFGNPEQLFAAGYAACFDGALNLMAKMEHIKTEQTETTALVSLNKDDEGGFFISVELQVKVPGVDGPTADRLVAKANQFCPYSRATRNNVPITLTVL